MRRALAAISLAFLSNATPAADDARPTDICAAPAELWRLTDALPKTRAALASGRPWKIVTLGSSSTAGAGASAARFSYPSRLAVELAQRYPGASLEIDNRGVNGEDAAENMKRLDSDVLDDKPDLVIWQVGTNALLRNVNDDDFGRDLDRGIERMRAAGIEVLLMDLQYAPRVIEVPDRRRMLDQITAIGARHHQPVFHRYAVMKFWADTMRASYASMISSDGLHLNDTSYGCLAERLADAIVGDGPVHGSRHSNAGSVRSDGGHAPAH